MRWSPVVMAVLFLASCDQIPGLRSCGGGGPRFKRQTAAEPVDCEARNGRRPRDGCVSATLRCGETLKGNTAGGRNNLEDDFYNGKYCLPFTHGYAGPERIYVLEVPPQTSANLWLDSDCADLDLFAMRWTYDGTCPTTSHPISECEADDGTRGGMVHVETVDRPATYLVVVDGKDGVTAPFHVTAECAPR